MYKGQLVYIIETVMSRPTLREIHIVVVTKIVIVCLPCLQGGAAVGLHNSSLMRHEVVLNRGTIGELLPGLRNHVTIFQLFLGLASLHVCCQYNGKLAYRCYHYGPIKAMR
jgi:hypothetical protein